MFKYLLPLISFVLGLGCIVDGIQNIRDNTAFAAHAETASILPIENYETYAVYKQKSLFDEKKYVGTYNVAELNFRTKSGQMVTVPSKALPPGLVEASRRSQSFTIRYLPERPTTIRFDEREPPATSEVLLGIVLIFAGAYYAIRAARS